MDSEGRHWAVHEPPVGDMCGSGIPQPTSYDPVNTPVIRIIEKSLAGKGSPRRSFLSFCDIAHTTKGWPLVIK